MTARWMWLMVGLVAAAEGAIAAGRGETATVPDTSENFRVQIHRSSQPVSTAITRPLFSNNELLGWCESTRSELIRAWCGHAGLPSWEPRCDVHVHLSQATYLAAVGSGGAQTAGSSWIRIENRRVVSRRIDLLVTPERTLPALPHELTHVVLADRFGSRQPPHWLDEGIAMLADTEHKQLLHERDCRNAMRLGTSFPLHELLHLEHFQSPSQMPAFYGQSASLLRFLGERGGLERVAQFGVDAMEVGYDSALKRHYGINSVTELEQQWRSFVYRHDSAKRSLKLISVCFAPPLAE